MIRITTGKSTLRELYRSGDVCVNTSRFDIGHFSLLLGKTSKMNRKIKVYEFILDVIKTINYYLWVYYDVCRIHS